MSATDWFIVIGGVLSTIIIAVLLHGLATMPDDGKL